MPIPTNLDIAKVTYNGTEIPLAGGGGDITVESLSVTENNTYTAPSGKAYSPVVVNVPTGTERSSSDVTVSGRTVTVPAGLYSAQVKKSVSAGTAGIPTASKSINGHTATITPIVTNDTGYIAGGTIDGYEVTVTATELASGSKTITENGEGIDVVGYASVDINVPSQAPVIQSKTITENGTYTPPTGVDGFAPVIVNVQGGGGGEQWITLGVSAVTTLDAFMRLHPIPVPTTGRKMIILRVTGTVQQGSGSATVLAMLFPFVNGQTYFNANGQMTNGRINASGVIAPDDATGISNPSFTLNAFTITDGYLNWPSSGITFYIGVGNTISYRVVEF